MIINSSNGYSGQGDVVVAESLSISTDRVEVHVGHSFLSSQAFLKEKVSQFRVEDR